MRNGAQGEVARLSSGISRCDNAAWLPTEGQREKVTGDVRVRKREVGVKSESSSHISREHVKSRRKETERAGATVA